MAQIKKIALIIGASRGIGLGLAKELAARGWHVIASERTHSEELAQLAEEADVEIVKADVTDHASIEELADRFDDEELDLLVANAGVYGPHDQSLVALGREDVADILMTNAVGPAQAVAALIPKLKDGSTVGLMTSKMGSIEDSSGGSNHYRLSKVAQNMLARSLFEKRAKPRGMSVLSLHPGWVQTAMGGENALISVEESTRGLADVLEAERQPEHAFLAYDGSTIPW